MSNTQEILFYETKKAMSTEFSLENSLGRPL